MSAAELDLGPCRWFAGCDRRATHLEPHPGRCPCRRATGARPSAGRRSAALAEQAERLPTPAEVAELLAELAGGAR